MENGPKSGLAQSLQLIIVGRNASPDSRGVIFVAPPKEYAVQLDKLTVKTQEAVQAALDIATRQSNQALEPEHLLLALVQQDDGVVRPLLQKLGASPDRVASELEAAMRSFSKVQGGGQPYASNDFNKVMQKAFDEAAKLKDEYVSGDHLVLAILDHGKGGAFAALKIRARIAIVCLRRSKKCAALRKCRTPKPGNTRRSRNSRATSRPMRATASSIP